MADQPFVFFVITLLDITYRSYVFQIHDVRTCLAKAAQPVPGRVIPAAATVIDARQGGPVGQSDDLSASDLQEHGSLHHVRRPPGTTRGLDLSAVPNPCPKELDSFSSGLPFSMTRLIKGSRPIMKASFPFSLFSKLATVPALFTDVQPKPPP
ncbi:hypothetical protein FA13DRAFT_49819 [Coprinellus micaceus]|uniref:Uncharacterized protein n=1 Tax=Coprinellus micaceus TaxID=71717 RepID=A0A4Y7U1V9_COPMI|nr:hypothetical protein FA13DRAFT_49819 [Coprinellus micaceus]